MNQDTRLQNTTLMDGRIGFLGFNLKRGSNNDAMAGSLHSPCICFSVLMRSNFEDLDGSPSNDLVLRRPGPTTPADPSADDAGDSEGGCVVYA
jgi:hypothetical protein